MQAKKRSFITTGAEIVRRETPLGLYKGLGAVLTGIVPKMAIRFTSFEAYKKLLANKETGAVSGQSTFLGKYFSSLFEIKFLSEKIQKFVMLTLYDFQLVLPQVSQRQSQSLPPWKSSRSGSKHNITLWPIP